MIPFATFVAFDLETTGLDAARNKIIEVAGVKFTLEVKKDTIIAKTIGTYESLVKPTMHIPEEATQINGISNEDVEDAPGITGVLADFTKFCGISTILVAHNASFDARFLQSELAENNLPLIKNPIVDSLAISKKIMPESPSHKLGNLAKRLRRQMNITLDSENLHRALYDCEILREVFVAILRKRFKQTDLQMDTFFQSMEKIGVSVNYLK
ncbi:MAG: 3'-5' exonuclease [Fibrobacterales bacterium]